MKTFKRYIKEMDLRGFEPDYSDIEDKRNTLPNFKPGDKVNLGGGRTRTLSQKNIDDIRSGKDRGGSPFPDSWAKNNTTKITKTASNDIPVSLPKPVPDNNKENQSGIEAWLKNHPMVANDVFGKKAAASGPNIPSAPQQPTQPPKSVPTTDNVQSTQANIQNWLKNYPSMANAIKKP